MKIFYPVLFLAFFDLTSAAKKRSDKNDPRSSTSELSSLGEFRTPTSFSDRYPYSKEDQAIRIMNRDIRQILSDYELGLVRSIRKKNRQLYRLLVKGRGIGDMQRLELMRDWSKASIEAMSRRVPITYASLKNSLNERWKRTGMIDLAGGNHEFASGEHRALGGGKPDGNNRDRGNDAVGARFRGLFDN